ncbi:MAG: class I SAM-dependent methyltransferase [Armatimonadota bacterium]
MPIDTAWKNAVEAKIKPYGKRKWEDIAIEYGRQIISDKSKAHVLEVGCGERSFLSRSIRQEHPDIWVVGIDINDYCLCTRTLMKSKLLRYMTFRIPANQWT